MLLFGCIDCHMKLGRNMSPSIMYHPPLSSNETLVVSVLVLLMVAQQRVHYKKVSYILVCE